MKRAKTPKSKRKPKIDPYPYQLARDFFQWVREGDKKGNVK